MRGSHSPLFRLVLSTLCAAAVLPSQAAGLRGAAQEPPLVVRMPAPDAASAERVITIEAVAEVRVVPTRLRLVFAISATGEDTSSASMAARERVAAARARLQAAGTTDADIDVDFIAAVPVYGWRVEAQNGRDVLAEQRTGTRVQYNLHVGVADEAAARAAIEVATVAAGADLLAVDYWSSELDEKRTEAQQKALAEAQRKAKLLLAVFAEPPKPVNVHEETRVLFPQQLYQNLPRAEDSTANWSFGDQVPRVAASRPLQVYYRGLFADVDAGDAAMPGLRHIEVVSTVRLYFAAPDRPLAK